MNPFKLKTAYTLSDGLVEENGVYFTIHRHTSRLFGPGTFSPSTPRLYKHESIALFVALAVLKFYKKGGVGFSYPTHRPTYYK